MVVYVDVVFVVNLAIDYLLLLAAAGFSGLPYKKRRLLLAAFIGAVYAVLTYLPHLTFLSDPPCFISACLVMLLTAFGTGKRKLVNRSLIFIGIAFLFGGALTCIFSFIETHFVHIADIPVWAKVPLVILTVALGCGLLSSFFGGGGTHGLSGEIIKVELELNGKKAGFSALIDTGNTLRDPITNARVIIAEPQAVRSLMSYKFRTSISDDEFDNPLEVMEKLILLEAPDKLRLLPYRALGKEGILLTFMPDLVRLDGKIKKDILIALAPGFISEGAGYCALAGVTL